MKKLTVLTGAGISAQSGLKTFRDSNGLWEGHDIMEVATPQGWEANAELVLKFYNQRIADLKNAQPNAAHHHLVDLEKYFDVNIITQNVDDLHERAGSKNILHLHGELVFAKSSVIPWRTPIDKKINWGDTCPKGFQLRPDVVWFGEEVPNMDKAISIVQTTDILLIVGTSLQVYPAAGLAHHYHHEEVYIIDPNEISNAAVRVKKHFRLDAISGMREFKNYILTF